MKHTPEPWKIERCDCKKHPHICPDYIIMSPQNCDGRFSQADATLICAAPEMLRILQKLEKIFSFRANMKKPTFQSELQCVRDVIEQATGE